MSQSQPVRWAELTPTQQANFGNGCGPKWVSKSLAKLLFGWFFEASCRRHDFGYARGGTKADKESVDNGFHKAMIRDAERLAEQHKYAKHIAAWLVGELFYLSVKTLGWMQFNYGPYRSLSELVPES